MIGKPTAARNLDQRRGSVGARRKPGCGTREPARPDCLATLRFSSISMTILIRGRRPGEPRSLSGPSGHTRVCKLRRRRGYALGKTLQTN